MSNPLSRLKQELTKTKETKETEGTHAHQANALALFESAMRHQQGIHRESTEEDMCKARECLEASAALGHQQAIFYLGIYYEMGLGGPMNTKKALALYEQLCRGQSSPPSAENLFKSATDNGTLHAFERLIALRNWEDVHLNVFQYWEGLCAELGIYSPLPENSLKKSTAFEYYSKAAERGDPDAIYRVGRCLEFGIGTEINEVAAISWYKKIAETHGKAAVQMVLCEEMGKGGLQKINDNAPSKWLVYAVKNGIRWFDSHPTEQGKLKHQIPEFISLLLQWIARDLQLQNNMIHYWCFHIKKNTLIPETFIAIGRDVEEHPKNLDSKLLLLICYYYGIGTVRDLKKAQELCESLLTEKHPCTQALYCCLFEEFEHRTQIKQKTILNELFQTLKSAQRNHHFSSVCVLDQFGRRHLDVEQRQYIHKLREIATKNEYLLGEKHDKKEIADFNLIDSIDYYANALQHGRSFFEGSHSIFEFFNILTEICNRRLTNATLNILLRIQAAEKILELINKIERGATLENPIALFNWGCCLLFGLGVKRNPKRAVDCFELSLKKGFCLAKPMLAHCYYHGEGVTPSLLRAFEYDGVTPLSDNETFYSTVNVTLLWSTMKESLRPYFNNTPGPLNITMAFLDDPIGVRSGIGNSQFPT